LVQERLDILLDDVIEEPLGEVGVHAALEGEGDGKVEVASLRMARDRLELPHRLQVVEHFHVSAHSRAQMRLEEHDVGVISFSEERRETDDQGGCQVVLVAKVDLRLFAPRHELVIILHSRHNLKHLIGRITQGPFLRVELGSVFRRAFLFCSRRTATKQKRISNRRSDVLCPHLARNDCLLTCQRRIPEQSNGTKHLG